MARQVLPWVGMAVGAMVGAPQIGFMVGSLIGNAIDPQVINGPKLGEGQDNNASEGGYRPIVLGKGAVGVCMIHEGPMKKRTIRHKQSKGGGPVTTEERAYRTMAFALGESAYPETGVMLTRLWIDNKLRYDVTPTSQIPQESEEFASEFTFYPGDNDQLPDPDLEAFMGAGNVPSYRGGSPYIVFPDWDVTDSRGMAPMIKAELVSSGSNAAGWVMTAANSGGAVAEGNKVWHSSDLTSWDGPYDRVPTPIDRPTFGPIRFGDGLIIAGEGSVVESTDDLDFADGLTVTLSDSVASPSIGRIRTFGNITVAMNHPLASGNKYWLKVGSAAWHERTVPSNPIAGGLIDIARLDSGRWIGLLSDGPSTRFIYSDDELPSTWSSASGGFPSTDGSIACNGQSAAYLGTAGRISETSDGASWVHTHTLSIPATPGRDAAQDTSGGALFLSSEHTSGSGIVVKNGGAWTLVNAPLPNFQVQRMEFGNGALVVSIPQSAFEGGVQRDAAVAYPPYTTFQWLDLPDTIANRIRIAYYFTATRADKLSLADVISWVHERVGAPPWKFNVSQLTDMVEGIVFADGYTAADAIRTQMALYFFDAGEFDAGSGYRINYVKRGASASVTLTEDDIVDGPEDWEREDSYERPRALHVAYQNPVADYGAPNITIKRTSPDVLVVGERSASVPNVFSDVDEITQRADIMMTVIYSEIAGTYDITMPISWLELAPTDCIGFSIRGRTRRLRLTNWRFSPDGTIKTEWMADRQSAYTSNVTGLPVVPPTPPPPSIVGPTVSAVLDIPALIDALDSLHVVLAASGQTEAWYGSIHQRKLPSDSDYATIAQFSAPTTIMGTLQFAVSAASPHYTDTTNVVRVKLYSDDDLDTYTQEQFLSEHGAFALAWDDGGVRRWEVCQYRDAVKVGDMEWELTTLLRGRLNTEAEEHPVGSMFVLLDSGIRVAPAQSSWIGQDITHRAVSNGQLPDNAIPYVETYTGESQREWPVAHVILDLAGDELSVEIVPRHRFGTDDHPVRSLNWDGYRIEATDGVNSAAMTTASDTATIDVTGWSGTITVTVAQINRITGAGPTVSETIDL